METEERLESNKMMILQMVLKRRSKKAPKDYKVYYLSGGPDSAAGTKYLFIGDSLNGNEIDLYRRALLASVNKLNDSDASEFFNPRLFLYSFCRAC